MEDKNYEKYSYFVSKASNFAIVIKPDRKKSVDGEVVFEEGLRKEFHNKMLRVENSPENEYVLKVLRDKIDQEKDMDPKRRTFFEETKPMASIPENVVLEKLEEKNSRIAELEAENKKLKTGNVVPKVTPVKPEEPVVVEKK